MIANRVEIIGRLHDGPVRRANLSYFRLREHGHAQQEADVILSNPGITLYSLDFENKQAVFVETPADVDLSQAAFYLTTQYEKAERVWTISFETMLQLAASVALDDSRLVSIYSVGRCGSTLASQVFAQVPGVVNISEPAVLSQLVIARNTKVAHNDELIALLDASIRLLCKTAAQTAWVIKGQSFVIELGDWLHNLYPQSKNLFLYRHAETWLRSGLRAYGQGPAKSEEESQLREKQRREILGPLVPSIAQYDPNVPLPHAGTLSLMWLRAISQYVKYCQMGHQMLAIRYESWRKAPHKTASTMLDYCQCKPTDMTAIYETLNRDSQAGTHLSRGVLGQHKRVLADHELAELNRHLQNHAFIQEAGFEVPYTMTLADSGGGTLGLR